MAERQGFEPWGRLRAQRFSRPPRSTAPAPLRERVHGPPKSSAGRRSTSGADHTHAGRGRQAVRAGAVSRPAAVRMSAPGLITGTFRWSVASRPAAAARMRKPPSAGWRKRRAPSEREPANTPSALGDWRRDPSRRCRCEVPGQFGHRADLMQRGRCSGSTWRGRRAVCDAAAALVPPCEGGPALRERARRKAAVAVACGPASGPNAMPCR